MEILTLKQSAERATDMFCTFKEGVKPRLIPTGFKPVDDIIGGIFPGTCGVLGAATGVGKSSLMLYAALHSSKKVGIVSLEDGPDVVGSRGISHDTRIDGLDLRKKSLSGEQIAQVRRSIDGMDDNHLHVAYGIGAPMEEIAEAVQDLATRGCEMVWLDYIHKVKGSSDNRTTEVSRAYTLFQRACARAGVACMVVCQFSRKKAGTVPELSWLKETGDLENEARLVLLGHIDAPGSVQMNLVKCTFGGEGTQFWFRRNEAGVLEDSHAPSEFRREDF